MKKIACLFPGVGYTCDKPLLYYSWKLLRGMDWEIVPVQYSGFPSGAKGDAEKMRQCADMALEQAEELPREIDWKAYSDILFIGKSIGTVICAAYAKRHGLNCRQILFTPVEDTFRFVDGNAIAFHGTADPWADTKTIEEACTKRGILLRETEKANHSLETGDVDADIREMRKVIKTVRVLGKEKGRASCLWRRHEQDAEGTQYVIHASSPGSMAFFKSSGLLYDPGLGRHPGILLRFGTLQ